MSPSNYVLSGSIGADVVTTDPTTGAYASKNVGGGIGVSVSGLALSGAAARNYDLASTTTSANIGVITPATLSYVADSIVWIFGAARPNYSGTVTGLVGGDALASVASGTPTFTSLATATSPPGVYSINGSGLTLRGSDYVLIEAPGDATALTVVGSNAADISGSWFIPSSPFAADGAPAWWEPVPITFCTPGALVAALESRARSFCQAADGAAAGPRLWDGLTSGTNRKRRRLEFRGASI